MKHLKLPKGNDVQFYFEIFADCVDLQAIVPMYPSRLVAIANTNPSPILLHHCYISNSMKVCVQYLKFFFALSWFFKLKKIKCWTR